MEEIEQLKKRFNSNKRNFKIDRFFSEYGRVYYNTNENLKGYITNLEDKRVLTVSSSGDQLLNILGSGSLKVDTFDINRYSPLIQNLKLYSIKYLDNCSSINFLERLNKKIYLKFNNYLPKLENQFFDCLFEYKLEDIYDKLFYYSLDNNKVNNNYFNINILNSIRNNIDLLEHNHFICDIYNLHNYIDNKYDAIYLSNISHYARDIDKFLDYINYLRSYLNDNGKIYYGYLYEKYIYEPITAIKNINNNFNIKFDKDKYLDIIKHTEVLNIDCAEYPSKKDSVLVLRK